MQSGKTFASSCLSLQLHAHIYSPLLFSFLRLPLLSMQCPRSSAGASRVVVSIPATFMPHFHAYCSGDTDRRPALCIPVTRSPYNMSFSMRSLDILWTWSSNCKRRWLSSVYIHDEAGSRLQYLCVGNLVLPGDAKKAS